MAFVRDRWFRRQIRLDGSIARVPTKFHGDKNIRRWQAVYIDARGIERAPSFVTKSEAEDFLDQKATERRTGVHVDEKAGRATIGSLAQRWIDTRADLKPSSLSRYRNIIDKHIEPEWGRARVSDVLTSDVQSWVAQLSRTTVSRQTRTDPLSAASIRKIFRVLSMIFDAAVLDGRIARNPCEKVKLPRAVAAKRRYLTHAEVDRLAQLVVTEQSTNKHRRTTEQTPDESYALVVFTLAYCGLRWSELAALKVGSLDPLRRRINVTEAVVLVDGRHVWGTPKSYEVRSVPMPVFLADALAAHAHGKGADELLFTGRRSGGPLRVRDFRRGAFDRAAAAMGADDLVPHGLRHTAASLAVSSGANVKAVQRMLGHAQASVTLDVYSDLLEDDADAVATSMEAARTKALARAATESSPNAGQLITLDVAAQVAVAQ